MDVGFLGSQGFFWVLVSRNVSYLDRKSSGGGMNRDRFLQVVPRP